MANTTKTETLHLPEPKPNKYPKYRLRKLGAGVALVMGWVGTVSALENQTPLQMGRDMYARSSEIIGNAVSPPHYEIPTDKEPYRVVKIGSTTKMSGATKEGYYNSIGAIISAIGVQNPLSSAEVYALNQMLQKQNVQQQKELGRPEGQIDSIIVHPGQELRIPADFEGVGTLVEPKTAQTSNSG